jgi:large subunit ribosomal protein L29
MKTEELRELDAEELGGRLKGARRELYELRFKLAVGQLDNHREIRKARKEIARILTVVHQRRLEAVEGEPFTATPAGEEPEAAEEAAAEAEDAVEEGAVEGGATPSATAAEVETVESEATEPTEGAGAEPEAAADTGAESRRTGRRQARRAGNEDER